MASTQEEVNGNVSKKKIADLRVVDLRGELEKRGLDRGGVKVALIERLSNALTSEGKDPELYLFEVASEVTPSKKMVTKRVNQKLASASESNNSGGAEDLNEDDEKMESEDENLKLGDSEEEDKEEVTQQGNSKESPDLEDDAVEEAIEDGESVPAEGEDEENYEDEEEEEGVEEEEGELGNEEDEVDGQTSPPKPESAPVIDPFNVNDTINMDTSCAHKATDNASLIVHVDDTQSDLDGDLETGTTDKTGKEGNASLNSLGAGKHEKSTSSSYGKEKDEANEKEKRTSLNKTVSSLQDDDDDDIEVIEVKQSTPIKEPAKTSTGKKNASVKEKNSGDKAVSSASTTEANHSSKEAGKSSQEADAGSAASATVSTSSSTTNVAVKTKSAAKQKVEKDGKGATIKKQLVVSSRNLWVSGLSTQTRATDLKTLFSKNGKVISAKIVTNSKSPGGHCYGFITMSTSEEASKCIQHLHRTELHGKMISVEKTGRDPLTAVRKTDVKVTLSPGSVNRRFSTKIGTSGELKRICKTIVKTVPDTNKDDKAERSDKAEGAGDSPAERKAITKTVVVKDRPGTGREATSRDRDKSKSRDKSRDRSRDKSRDRLSYRSERFHSSHGRVFRPRFMRPVIRGFRSRFPRGMMTMRSRFMNTGFRKPPFFMQKTFPSPFKPRTSMLTFQKIKEERLRQRHRDRERELRDVEWRRMQDIMRQKDIERKQRDESVRLDRERERLRIERDKLERERADILRLEREKQKLERERFEREKEELRRRDQMRFDETRRVLKRPYDNRGVREPDAFWEDRKKPNRFQDFEHREKEHVPFERHEPFERRPGGGPERFQARDKPVEGARDFEIRRDVRRPPAMNEREDRGNRAVERPYERGFPKEDFRAGQDRDIKGSHRGRERMGPQRVARPPPGDEQWKSGGHDRRVHDSTRERYVESGKGMGMSGNSYNSHRTTYGGGDRGHTWSSGNQSDRGVNKSYNNVGGNTGTQWGTDSRKVDSSHGQSWSSTGDRWAHGGDQRNNRQDMPQTMMSGQQSGMYGGSVAQGGAASHSGVSSNYGGDRFMAPMRRY